MSAGRKSKHTAHQPDEVELLGYHLPELRRAERKLGGLLRRVLQGLSVQERQDAADRLDVLVSSFPRLRLPAVSQHPAEARNLLLRLDPTTGPLPGFEEAMERLWDLVVTPASLHRLRSVLYTVAAQAADRCPELLPTVALAVLSTDRERSGDTVFLEMVVAASAIEWFVASHAPENGHVSLDVGSWLASEPSDALRMAIGEGPAYYYAGIPGVYQYLDPSRILFDVYRLTPYARQVFGERILCDLVDHEYKLRLRREIERVREIWRQRHSARSRADADMLASRALQALDCLPPHANPLLQVILVQSWVRYFELV